MRFTRPVICFFTVFTLSLMMVGDVLAQPPGGPGGPRPRRGRADGFEPGDRRPNLMRMIPVLAALDADEDGEISAAEIENAVAALKTLDKNKDGKLDQAELRPAGGPGPRFGGPGGPGFGGPGGPGGFGGDPEALADRLFEGDKNGDKQLSADELPERIQNFVERADKNDDKLLTREELIAMFKERAARGRGRGGRGGGFGGRGGDGPGQGNRPPRPDRPE